MVEKSEVRLLQSQPSQHLYQSMIQHRKSHVLAALHNVPLPDTRPKADHLLLSANSFKTGISTLYFLWLGRDNLYCFKRRRNTSCLHEEVSLGVFTQPGQS